MTEKEAFNKGLITETELKYLYARILHAIKTDTILLGDNPEDKSVNSSYYMPDDERNTHMHIMGRSGGGKSRLIEFMVRQDIKRGAGLCVIDPHGELYWNLLFFIIKECEKDIWDRVYLINPSQDDYLIQFNPFSTKNKEGVEAHTDKILSSLEKVWEKDLTDSPGILKYLTVIIQTAIIKDMPMIEVLKTLYSDKKRKEVYKSIENDPNISEEMRSVWIEIVSNSKGSENIISGAHTRLKYLLSSPSLQMMTLKKTSLDLTDAINNNGIILVNLGKTPTFSLKNQKVFGTLLLNEFVNFFDNRGESFRYAGDPSKQKRWNPFFMYVDEFQRYLTTDIGEVLAGGRKFGFHMIMANQTFSQLDEKTREEINNIASAKAYFAVKDINIAIDIWKQSGVYEAKIKETVRKFQTIDEGYTDNTTISVSTNAYGKETVTKGQQKLKQSQTIAYDDNKYYSEQETALIEGKKIQQMKPRHFLFTSDGMPNGTILKTEWCFDIKCSDDDIKNFHKYLAEKHPNLYYKVDDLKAELNRITHPHLKSFSDDQKEFLQNGQHETIKEVFGNKEEVEDEEDLFN